MGPVQDTAVKGTMGKAWFRVKTYGYGAGLPCRWQGWVVIAFYAVAVICIALSGTDEDHPWLYLAIIACLTAIVVFLAWAKSDKAWRWRHGDEEN